MTRKLIQVWTSLVAALAIAGCSATMESGQATGPKGAEEEDLPIGDRLPDDSKADGDWGDALKCKAIPDFPSLQAPEITVSLNGLTVHLVDRATGYDKVFPVGVGAINTNEEDSTYLESRSYYPLLATGKADFVIDTSKIEPCKTWWTDSATGERSPVFAGLPFIRWWGSYGMHGPIDNYRQPNGGTLRRGFVSHGCFRMEAADVLEVYARIKDVARVPLHIQREPERDSAGRRIDIETRWIGAECSVDLDCNFEGGFCKHNPLGGRGFCSARCSKYCSDKKGYPSTFCVADPDDPMQGMCVAKETAQNMGCRPIDHMVPRPESRFQQPSAVATVCMPGSPGWIGDRCMVDADCTLGTRCAGALEGKPGICTMPCSGFCPDQPGWPRAFCAVAPSLGGASCLRQCTPASNFPECPADSDCLGVNETDGQVASRFVCLPREPATPTTAE